MSCTGQLLTGSRDWSGVLEIMVATPHPRGSFIMTRWPTSLVLLLFLVAIGAPGLIAARDLPAIKLPPPQTGGGTTLMQVLKARHSAREFDTTKRPLQMLSNQLS
jgi:hypothetical protein